MKEQRSGAAEDSALTVIYDGQCNLCLASVDRLGRLGSRAELTFVPLQNLDRLQGRAAERVLDVGEEALRDRMHVVDGAGRLYAGSDAVVRILRTVPGFGPAGWLYRLPGMSRLGDWIYRYIAERRYDWFGKADEACSPDECRVPPGDMTDKTL
ncbi:thiol-disulfide oxidoreductase DCC family protein [Paenibacillus sp. D51F]